MLCWFCEKESGITEGDFGEHRCKACNVLIDVLNPNKPDWKPEIKPTTTQDEWLQKREAEMLLGGKYLKASDCKTGDTIEFLDEGIWEESRSFKNDDGTPKHQCMFQIKHGGEEKTITLNKTNRETLILAWGRDTSKWLGKKAEITLKEVEVAGEDKTVIRLKAV